MSADDKTENATEKGLGKAKEAFGDATDNDELAAEGKTDQAKADVKDAGEKVKDAAENAKDAFDRNK
ncbi:CsbD family protein [Promicromonospora sp. NPDC023987]|uniref:CsbD family protein n=1 Tax=Promicromonospora sp. NPDC023987 TaxID=3155360 RepID=UPI0033CBE4CC